LDSLREEWKKQWDILYIELLDGNKIEDKNMFKAMEKPDE
jgi:hypothetical protein